MTQLDEQTMRLLELLRTYGRWHEPIDDRQLSDDEADLVRRFAEDRLGIGTDPHVQAVHLVARSRRARELWTTFIQMQSDIESRELESMQQSLEEFVDSKARSGPDLEEQTNNATYSAKVIDLVARLRKSGGAPRTGFVVKRYAAETQFASVGRGKYVTDDMVMSLVFPSMDAQAAPIGFLITCSPDVVRAKYIGKRFRVLFVEPESHKTGTLAHRIKIVGPFDSFGEIEERFDGEMQLDRCIVPVWIDVVDD